KHFTITCSVGCVTTNQGLVGAGEMPFTHVMLGQAIAVIFTLIFLPWRDPPASPRGLRSALLFPPTKTKARLKATIVGRNSWPMAAGSRLILARLGKIRS